MHHTIIAVDVEKFGTRSELHQGVIRDGLNAAMRDTFDGCGLSWAECYHEDRGDGLFVLVPVHVENRRLVECLPNELGGRLREHNAKFGAEGGIRLRVVLHAGEIEHDEHGVRGTAMVHAFRLLDSDVLKEALADTHGILALITSPAFFRDVIRDTPAAKPDLYWEASVSRKETDTAGWLYQPDNHPAQVHEEPEPEDPPVPGDRPAKAGFRPAPPRALSLVALLLAGGLVGDVFAAAPPDDRCAEPVQLNVSVSAEKAVVVQKLVPAFERRSRDGNDGCKAVNVRVTVAHSADMVIAALGRAWTGPDDLRNVGPEPHVVLPDSSWEVDAAVAALRRDERTDITLDIRGSIARSPLVLAEPMPAGETAGLPDQPNSWHQVLATALRSSPVGDGAQVRRPSPVTSGTGLAATVALYAAALGQDLNARALTTSDAPSRLHDVEWSIAAGEESYPTLCALRQQMERSPTGAGGPALMVSEKAAGDYNEGSALGEQCPPRQRSTTPQLNIAYPSDGTVYLDHPFVEVTWKSRPANSERQKLVRQLYEFLAGPEAQSELRRERIRDRNGDIASYAGAPPGRPQTLPIDSVDVLALLQAFEDARKSARVLFLFDVSAAMEEPFRDVGGTRLRAAVDAVTSTLRSVGERDEVGVWDFADGLAGGVDHRVLVPVGRAAGRVGGRSRAEATRESLSGLRTTGRQARLYDTLRAAVGTLRASGGSAEDTRDAVVIIADGSRPEPGHSQLAEYLRSGGQPVPVFLVAFGTPVCATPQWQEIVRATGGACQQAAGMADIEYALDGLTAALWGEGLG